jgi:hypothetical protein
LPSTDPLGFYTIVTARSRDARCCGDLQASERSDALRSITGDDPPVRQHKSATVAQEEEGLASLQALE